MPRAPQGTPFGETTPHVLPAQKEIPNLIVSYHESGTYFLVGGGGVVEQALREGREFKASYNIDMNMGSHSQTFPSAPAHNGGLKGDRMNPKP